MQEFLKNKKVDCNVMSLTGFRTLILLRELLKGPMSNEEINQCFLNNEYIKETFSADTLRLYINSLRDVGCEISKAGKSTNNKYVLTSHPFTMGITKSQLSSVLKVYCNIYDKIGINDVILLKNIFEKISKIVPPDFSELILNSSLLKGIDLDFLNEINLSVKKKNQITFLYASPNSGEKLISVISDKLEFKSKKLYLWGYSSQYGEYSYFRVDRIKKILTVNLKPEKSEIKTYTVTYKLYSEDEYVLKEDEKLLSQNENVYVIEKTSKNKFNLIQDLLFILPFCKIISPDEIREELVQKLKEMEAFYGA